MVGKVGAAKDAYEPGNRNHRMSSLCNPGVGRIPGCLGVVGQGS